MPGGGAELNLPETDLKDKVVLVTGAGKGSGRSLAIDFASKGARLAINDITPVNLDETESQIRAAGGEVKSYVVDLAKKMPIQSMINQVNMDFGRIDILVHCAEVKPLASVLEMDGWDWQRTLDVNLTGSFLLMQSAGRLMEKQGGGLIMLMAPHLQTDSRQVAYGVSKAGVVELILQASQEFNEHGITLRALDPALPVSMFEQALFHISRLAEK